MLLAALIWLAGGLTTPAAAELRAQLSAMTTAVDQPVELVLETAGAPSAPLDLSQLEADFVILDRRTSSSVSIIDGRRDERYRVRLLLLPRHSGEIVVGPIWIGGEASPALTLTVAPGAGPPAQPPAPAPWTASPGGASEGAEVTVVVDAEPSSREVWLGEQILLTVRVWSRGALTAPRLTDPKPEGARALPLGEDRYPAERDGREHQVYERRYALFPRRVGRLEIGPVRFEASAIGATGALESYRAASSTLSVAVRPRPTAVPAARWLPARAVDLVEGRPLSTRLVSGQVLERVVTVRGHGVMAEDLPELALEAPFHLRGQRAAPQLWDERTPAGVIGHRIERLTLTATEPGRYRLPEVRVPWWDTAAGMARVAVLPAQTIEVLASASGGSGPAEPGPVVPDAGAGANGDQGVAAKTIPWLGIGLLLVAAWLGVRARARGRRPVAPREAPIQAPPEQPSTQDPLKAAIDAVQAAYADGDPAAAREALLAWSRHQWPEDPPRNLARIILRCPQPLSAQIALLEKAFFSPEPIRWERERVPEGLKALITAD